MDNENSPRKISVTFAQPETGADVTIGQILLTLAQHDLAHNVDCQVSGNIIDEMKIEPIDDQSEISDDLKKISIEMLEENRNSFDQQLCALYENLSNIDSLYNQQIQMMLKIFDDGVSIFHIVRAIVFGYRSLVFLYNRIPNPLRVVTNNLMTVMLSNIIDDFISSIGGWRALTTFFNTKSSTVLAIMAGIFAIFAIVCRD